MENPQKKIIIDEDRLSNLSGDVIQRIMDFLPVPDAARTCLLSNKWRYVWADHPSLVLDMDFWNHIQRHKSTDKKFEQLRVANIVSSILLHHIAHIRRFDLYFSGANNVSSNNVSSWLSYLCRRGLKVLHLTTNGTYKVPFGFFLTSELTSLSLSFCIIKEAVGCFTSIQSLILDLVELVSVVLTTPLLTSLSMKKCICKSGFDIFAPKLASLTLEYNANLNLKTFFTCTDINYAYLVSHGSFLLLPVHADGKNMSELLALWPRISTLVLNRIAFKCLATGSPPADNNDILQSTLRRITLMEVDLDSERISWILYLLKNSPLLHTFGISFGKDLMNDIDEEPMDFEMDQLRTVIMKDFTASRNQVKFVKILLKSAPSLEKLLVDEDEKLDVDKRMKILRELLVLPRINPKTEIVFAPKLF